MMRGKRTVSLDRYRSSGKSERTGAELHVHNRKLENHSTHCDDAVEFLTEMDASDIFHHRSALLSRLEYSTDAEQG